MKNILKKSFALALIAIMALSFAVSVSAASVAKVNSLKAYHSDEDEINLSWKKISNADGYVIYRYTTTGWKKQGSTRKTKFEVDDLKKSTLYKFKVRAYDVVNGEKVYGKYSSVITYATTPDEVENLKASKKTTSSVTLTWSKEKGATKYQVYMYDAAKGKYVRQTTVSGLKATVKNLEPGTTYKFKVRAYYKPGARRYYGEFSDTLSVKTSAAASTRSSVSNVTTSKIDKSKATEIALEHANLQKSQIREYECKLDKENGILVYEVEFSHGKYEYEYEINVETGKIISVEKHRD